jgi:hypothetical protein
MITINPQKQDHPTPQGSEVGEGLISWDAITQISRQKSWELIIESVHFTIVDYYVGFFMSCFFYGTSPVIRVAL